MAGTVEDDDGEIGDLDALGSGDGVDVPLDGLVDVDAGPLPSGPTQILSM